jgi:hypothetical protein
MPYSNAQTDGVTVSSPMSNNVIHTPIFDSIAEVKISDSLFSAQYGTGGIFFNQISKGGSNQFHGIGYDYLRNTAFNAADFQFGLDVDRDVVHYNALGGNIGGPVIKNKVFFFFGVERHIDRRAGTYNIRTLPTMAERVGDFSGQNPIYDPATQTVDPSTGIVTREPFANNQIPSSRLDPVAKNIQAIYPEPTLPGTVANGVTRDNWNYSLPRTRPTIKYFGRFDADITSKHRLSGSAAWNDRWGEPTGPLCPVGCTSSDIFNTNNQLSLYSTLSPTLTNEFRIGFMGEYDTIKAETLDQGWPEKLGLQFSKADIFPAIDISGGVYGLNPGLVVWYQENLIEPSDTLTVIRGRHILKFGGAVMIMRADSTAWGNTIGADLSFTGVYTAGSNTGSLAANSGAPYADFLLGYANDWNAKFSPQYGGRLKNPGVFIQDDFKVNRNLTLNLGLRWEGRTGWTDVYDNIRSFDPNLTNPATGTPGAMWYSPQNGRNSVLKGQWGGFLPRIGFAYLLGDKTTIRGGFGVYNYPWNVDTFASNSLGQAFQSSGNLGDSTNNVNPVVTLSDDGNTNFQGPDSGSINSFYKVNPDQPDSYNGQSVGYQQYDQPVPLLKSWNFTIQRQLSNSMVADIGYIGSHGSNLAWRTNLNQVPEGKLGPDSAQFRPYPNFQNINGITTDSVSNYNALQIGLRRRFMSGWQFNMSYTWSHMQSSQDSSGWGSKQGSNPWQRAYDPRANYGNSNFDIRHMFKFYTVYELPFGLGRQFLNQSKGLDFVIGGWTITGTFVAQGGNPFTPYMQTNNSYSLASGNGAVWYPNVVGDPKLANPTIENWFDVNAFDSPAPGTFGNMGRNIVFGPGLISTNLSLLKTFSITERIKFDFSANATNWPNHPSFAQPDNAIGPGHVGKITRTTVGGRQMEFVFKLRF